MFSKHSLGDFVVLCSGKPHFHKERRKVTYVNLSNCTIEVAGAELFDLTSGISKSTHRGLGAGVRRIYLAEGKVLDEAVICEVIRALSNLQLRALKRLPPGDILAAARLLKVL